MVYNLTTEVWKLESQIELIEDEMEIKSRELETIKSRSADSMADLEALNMEEKHLMQLWNSVIVNIQHKDKIHAEVCDEYELDLIPLFKYLFLFINLLCCLDVGMCKMN